MECRAESKMVLYQRFNTCGAKMHLKQSKIRIDMGKRFNAGYGIRTRELLRDRILSPAPLASLANPATI